MKRIIGISLAASLPLVLGACELAPKTSVQNGYRGTGMDTIKISNLAAADEVPDPPYDPPVGNEGPRASEVYENVQVLGNLSDEQFNYVMAAITEWVSPAEGCNYCHNPANMASDEIYAKTVARRMFQMTAALNNEYSNHTGQTGVTCWTCHRGENVPANYWTLPIPPNKRSIVNNKSGQNDPVSNSAYSSLPTGTVARYLLGGADPAENIRVVSETRFPTPANKIRTMQAEPSYGLMMHISQALGVNCTYCHNTQSFQSWSASNPSRQTAYYGIDMVRNINGQYITPLAEIFPANRKGELGDPFKVNCTTCHQGQPKPMGGFRMIKDYPALKMAGGAPVTATSTRPANLGPAETEVLEAPATEDGGGGEEGEANPT